MKSVIPAGLCFIVTAAIVAGLLPQLAPGIGDSATYAFALTGGVLVALVLAVIVALDEPQP